MRATTQLRGAAAPIRRTICRISSCMRNRMKSEGIRVLAVRLKASKLCPILILLIGSACIGQLQVHDEASPVSGAVGSA